MAEKNRKKTKTQSDYLSDSDSSEDEVSQHLCTSQEERLYGTVKGSMQATQVALSHTTVQCNPTVERLRNFLKNRHQIKPRRPKKRTSHCDIY